ncbi:MAG: LacI family DNA-binding transcriptional regulator [Phycisphaerales bacterium]
MASVRELARETGVSVATVSRVLNNHPSVSKTVRNRVLSAANKNNYRMSNSRRTAMAIGFVYTGATTLSSPFDAALLAGVGESLEETHYSLSILDANRLRQPGEAFSHLFMRHNMHGAILRASTGSYSACEAIAAEDFPAIMVGARSENPAVSYIHSESKSASREAIEHLIGLGHRRIAISMNVFDDQDHQDRLEGYMLALEDAGIPFDDKLVLRLPARRSSGDQVLKRILEMEDSPTAVFITDPPVAVGAVNAAQSHGIKIPENLSIVGFDDAEVRHSVYPKMTVVCQDAGALGRAAFQALIELIEAGKRKPFREVLRTWLEIHDTTGPPDYSRKTGK